jgi:hypothetical protein
MSRFRLAAVAAPESAPVDVLEAVANRRDLPTLVKHLNTEGADAGRVCCVFSSVPDTGDLLMNRADELGTLAALNPIDLRTRGMLVAVTVWRWEVHLSQTLFPEMSENRASCAVLNDVDG